MLMQLLLPNNPAPGLIQNTKFFVSDTFVSTLAWFYATYEPTSDPSDRFLETSASQDCANHFSHLLKMPQHNMAKHKIT